MTAEIAGYAMEELLAIGALDVFYTPIFMKKNRPAFKLSVICKEDKLEKVERVIFKETSTIGIRKYKADRSIMDREIKHVITPYGEVRVKVARYGDIEKSAAEYEDCKRLAKETGVSLKEIYISAINLISKN